MSSSSKKPIAENVLSLLRNALNNDNKINDIRRENCEIWSIVASDATTIESTRNLIVNLSDTRTNRSFQCIISRDMFLRFPLHANVWRTFCNKRDPTSSELKNQFVRVEEVSPPPTPASEAEGPVYLSQSGPRPATIVIKNIPPPARLNWLGELGLTTQPPETRIIVPEGAYEPEDYLFLTFKHAREGMAFLEQHKDSGLEMHWRISDEMQDRSRSVSFGWAGSIVDEDEVRRVMNQRASECGTTLKFGVIPQRHFGYAVFSTMREAQRFADLHSVAVKTTNGGEASVKIRRSKFRVPASYLELAICNVPDELAFLTEAELRDQLEAAALGILGGLNTREKRPRPRDGDMEEEEDTTEEAVRHIDYALIDPVANTVFFAPSTLALHDHFISMGVLLSGRKLTVIPTTTMNRPPAKPSVRGLVQEGNDQLQALQEQMRRMETRQYEVEQAQREDRRLLIGSLQSIREVMGDMRRAIDINAASQLQLQQAAQVNQLRLELLSQRNQITSQLFMCRALQLQSPEGLHEELERLNRELSSLPSAVSSPQLATPLARPQLPNPEPDTIGDTGLDTSLDEGGHASDLDF